MTMLRSILIMAAHVYCHVAVDLQGWTEGGGLFLSDGVIIRNISVKEFLYYIRCEAKRFLEKRSNQGRSGDGDIEEDSRRRPERIGGSQGLGWSAVWEDGRQIHLSKDTTDDSREAVVGPALRRRH